MGFSLKHLLDDVLHHGQQQQQQNNQQQRPAPAQTPPPGRGGQSQISVAAPVQQQHLVLTPPQAQPALHVGVAPQQNLEVGNQVIAPSPAARTAPPPPPQAKRPSLGEQLLHTLGNAPRFVDNAVVKPVVNTAKVPIDLGTTLGQELGGAPLDQQLKSANALENAWKGSLPGIVVANAEPLAKGIEVTPEAIAREVQNKPITDLQQKAFGTTNEGDIAKEIVGSTLATGLTVAAPEIGGAAGGAAAPTIGEIANPVAQRLAAAGVKAAVEAPVGAGFNVGGELATNPEASTGDLEKSAAQGAALFGLLGAAPEAAGAVREGTPKLIQYAHDNAAPLNEAGAIGKDVPAGGRAPEPAPDETPINQNKSLANEIDNSRGNAGQQNLTPEGNVPFDPADQKILEERLAKGEDSKQPASAAAPAGDRNANAEAAVIDRIKKNTSSDAILNNYMKDTGKGLQESAKDVSRIAKDAGLTTDIGRNPLEGTLKLPEVQKGDWKQATLNGRFVQYKEQEIGSKAMDSYAKLTPHDQLLLRQIENKTVGDVAKGADNPKAFKDAEANIRTYYDTRHAYDRGLGIDVGYRQNYLRHLFDRAETPEDSAVVSDQALVKGANKRPGYTQKRTGNVLASEVGNTLHRDIQGSSFNHAKLAYENGLESALEGKISHGELVRDKATGERYQQLDHPLGRDLAVPEDIAKQINQRVWKHDDGKISETYDKINHGLKYVKLSGGLFHAFTESTNFLGQQIASGKIFTDPTAAAKLYTTFFSPKAMDAEMARMADAGVLDKAHLGGLTVRPKEILADVNVDALDSGKNAVAKYTGIQAMHDATFQREIPYAKLKIFEQKTEGLDPHNPADMAKIREAAKGINNLFGGINREIHGITPKWFKIFQKGLLATDFTEAKITTLGKALTAKGVEGTLARQAVLGKVGLSALIASAGAAAFGDYKDKNAKQIAKDVAGNLLDPNFEAGGYKVGLPKTHVSELVDALKPTAKTGKAWNASGLVNYAQDRTAALPSEAIQLLSNKNYYGQPLYGTNTKKNGGGKISAPQTAENVAETVLPIPFGNAATTAEGKQNPAAAAANVVGFKAKPNTDNTQTFDGVETQLNDKQSEEYQSDLKTNSKALINQLKNSSSYKSASPNDQATAMSQLKSNITDATKRQFSAKYNLGQYAADYKGKSSDPTEKQQDIITGKINPDAYIKSSGDSDSYQVSQFKKSDKKTQEIGDKTYYKTKDGTVKSQDTFTYQTSRQKAKVALALDQAKSDDNFDNWKVAAVKQYQLYQDEINHYDPETESDKIDALTKQAGDLVDNMKKYAGYGGFTKPKKATSSRTKSSNGLDYGKLYSSLSYNKSLRSILEAAKVT